MVQSELSLRSLQKTKEPLVSVYSLFSLIWIVSRQPLIGSLGGDDIFSE